MSDRPPRNRRERRKYEREHGRPYKGPPTLTVKEEVVVSSEVDREGAACRWVLARVTDFWPGSLDGYWIQAEWDSDRRGVKLRIRKRVAGMVLEHGSYLSMEVAVRDDRRLAAHSIGRIAHRFRERGA